MYYTTNTQAVNTKCTIQVFFGPRRDKIEHVWVSIRTRLDIQSHFFFFYTLLYVRRRFLYVVNLEAPSEAPRKIARQSKWDVGTVQWNPHKTEAHLFAASVSADLSVLIRLKPQSRPRARSTTIKALPMSCYSKIINFAETTVLVYVMCLICVCRVISVWTCTYGVMDVESLTHPCKATHEL